MTTNQFLKKMLLLFLFCALFLGTVACSGTPNEIPENKQPVSNEVTTATGNVNVPDNVPDNVPCTHRYTETVKQEAMALKSGIRTLTCQECGNTA